MKPVLSALVVHSFLLSAHFRQCESKLSQDRPNLEQLLGELDEKLKGCLEVFGLGIQHNNPSIQVRTWHPKTKKILINLKIGVGMRGTCWKTNQR